MGLLRTVPVPIRWGLLLLAVLKLALLLRLNPALEWNSDEARNGRVAASYAAGRGYVSLDPVRQRLRPDAFHASFPVFIYRAWRAVGGRDHHYTLLVFALTVGAYLLGSVYAQRLLTQLGAPPALAWTGAALWAGSPAVFHYIGAYFWYENLALPALLLLTYKLIRVAMGRPLSWADALLGAVLITLSCLLRGYLLALYAVLLGTWWGLLTPPQRRTGLRLVGLTVGLLALGHGPILLKNHRMFNAWLLSTQPGFELLQGHNPVAQGRFMYDWDWRPGAFDRFVRANIPQLDSLDQYQESRARGQLALRWIAAHPGAEARLWGRKTVLFFSPEQFVANQLVGEWSLEAALTHLAFLVALAATALRWRGLRFHTLDPLLLAPVVAIWALSLLFFVGYRWRYFAEPGLLFFSLVVANRYVALRRAAPLADKSV